MLTDWFSGVDPVRDGVYLTRRITSHGPMECWFAMRWHGATRSWYAANTAGADQGDVIGWDRPNAARYEWRGLSQKPGIEEASKP